MTTAKPVEFNHIFILPYVWQKLKKKKTGWTSPSVQIWTDKSFQKKTFYFRRLIIYMTECVSFAYFVLVINSSPKVKSPFLMFSLPCSSLLKYSCVLKRSPPFLLGRQTRWSCRISWSPDLFSIQDLFPVFDLMSSMFSQNALVVRIYTKEHYKWRRESVQPLQSLNVNNKQPEKGSESSGLPPSCTLDPP